MNLELGGESPVGGLNLGVISTELICKAMRQDEITEGENMNREGLRTAPGVFQSLKPRKPKGD